MSEHNLSKNVKITKVMDAVAAGTSDQNGTIVDMQGFEGVVFVASFGTIATDAVTTLKAQQGAVATLSDAADLSGSGISVGTTDDTQLQVLDIYKPGDRYLRPVVDRGTGNAVIDGVIAIQYGARKLPTTNDSTTVANTETHISPAEGTA